MSSRVTVTRDIRWLRVFPRLIAMQHVAAAGLVIRRSRLTAARRRAIKTALIRACDIDVSGDTLIMRLPQAIVPVPTGLIGDPMNGNSRLLLLLVQRDRPLVPRAIHYRERAVATTSVNGRVI